MSVKEEMGGFKQMRVTRFILISVLIVANFFTFLPSSFAAESDVDMLLELLVKKNVLTSEDAAEFRAELALKKQEEKEKQKEFNITAGKALKISGYTQVRYRQDKSTNDGFDIRRARLTVQGDITERFDYKTQVELASSPTLLDAMIGFKVNPYIKLTAGQFKVPFSQENLTSSPKLETINRSQVVEALCARSMDVIGNQNGRDIGIQAGGSLLPKNDYNLFDYAIGVFNGAGINKVDLNEQKDVIGRLVFHPTRDLSLGSSWWWGRYTLSSAPASKNDRDRIGAEFAYVHEPISLRGEYIWGNDASINKQGWYIQTGYFFIPKRLQGVFKFDTFDPNTAIKNNETDIYTIGGNLYFNKWAFIQVDYELKDERGKEKDNNALTGQLTLQF